MQANLPTISVLGSTQLEPATKRRYSALVLKITERFSLSFLTELKGSFNGQIRSSPLFDLIMPAITFSFDNADGNPAAGK